MVFPETKPGMVIDYAYLWRSEQQRGLEETIRHSFIIFFAYIRVSIKRVSLNWCSSPEPKF